MIIKENPQEIFAQQREHRFQTNATSAEERIRKLDQFAKQLLKQQEYITQALFLDFCKPPMETVTTEILPLLSMINFTKKNLKKWLRAKSAGFHFLFWGTQTLVQPVAKGQVLVISPWNYPFQLALYPALTAYSAGNSVILKPSEFTPHTNKIIQALIREVFSVKEMAIFEGDKTVTTELMQLPFDHVFFTGSTPVGKIIMQKASEQLAGVSLELGGKSPVYVDPLFAPMTAAERLVWGKCVNAGQTCVAPDYILTEKKYGDVLAQNLWQEFEKQYPDYRHNQSLAGIIHEHHYMRLCDLVIDAVQAGAKLWGISLSECLALKNQYAQSKRLPLIILTQVTETMRVMQEEIFGPIFPILGVNDYQAAIKIITSQDYPLSLYLFSHNKKMQNAFNTQTQSGSFCVNETLLHVAHPSAPFGGIGKSGLGRYHGHYGFEEMSHMKTFLHRPGSNLLKTFYPPYTSGKFQILTKMVKYFHRFF